MKYNTTTHNRLFTLLFLLAFALPAIADDDTGFDDNVDDEQLTVNSYILPTLIAGIAAGYILIREKQAAI